VVGLATEFSSEKIPRNRLGMAFRYSAEERAHSEPYGTEFRAFFSSAERFGTEFREFSVLWNGSERKSESLLLFLFHGTEFRAFFSSAERFGTEFREFSVPRNSRNSAGTNQLFRLFRLPRNNFFVGNCQP
jgi:hypothetical protein